MNAQYPQEPHHPSGCAADPWHPRIGIPANSLDLSDSKQVAQQVGPTATGHQYPPLPCSFRTGSIWNWPGETYGVALIDASAPDLMTHLQSLEKQLPLVSPILLSPTPNQDTGHGSQCRLA
ncbi:MAG: hypothetical protein R2857_00500 [Vampirovibrionales bacterium]